MKLFELYSWFVFIIAIVLIIIVFSGIKSDIKWWILALIVSIVLRKLIRSK